MNFKCNECGSEVINISKQELKITTLYSLPYFPESWVEINCWKSSDGVYVNAECDGCGHIWRAEDLDGLKSMMLQQGVIYNA